MPCRGTLSPLVLSCQTSFGDVASTRRVGKTVVCLPNPSPKKQARKSAIFRAVSGEKEIPWGKRDGVFPPVQTLFCQRDKFFGREVKDFAGAGRVLGWREIFAKMQFEVDKKTNPFAVGDRRMEATAAEPINEATASE